jgi:hypothetical protein
MRATRRSTNGSRFTLSFECGTNVSLAMETQGVLTVVTEILPDHAESLAELLSDFDRAMKVGSTAPLVDFRVMDSVHFARFVVLPENGGKRHLAFSTAYDGPLAVHLTELVKRAQQGLSSIYEHCVGFSADYRRAPASFVAYLETHSVRHGALHVGYVGRTVRDVQGEENLRRFIEEKLDRAGTSAEHRSALAIREEIIGWVAESEYRWALGPRARPISPFGVDGWRSSAVAGLSALGVLAALLLGGGAAFAMGPLPFVLYGASVAGVGFGLVAWLRHHELTEPAKTDADIAHGLEHAEDEDLGVRNQLTHLVDVKKGTFRHVLLKLVLAAVELRARFQFYSGDLGGIETIHCAHWLILEGETPRLLFFSNYDGSWERYLGDFIEEAGGGMTSVWSNTVEFPRSRFLLFDGATNERVFKAWTREKQVKTDVWYRASPDISVRNLNDNSKLRDGLSGSLTEAEAAEWLRLL